MTPLNYSHNIFNRVKDIPDTVWDKLSCQKNTYFNKAYLSAFEAYHTNQILFRYLIIYSSKTPVALATIQVLDYKINTNAAGSLSNKFIEKLSHYLSCFLLRDYLKIVVCGNPFLSGEHGIYIVNNQDNASIMAQLVFGIQELIKNSSDLKNRTDVILIKDFVAASLKNSDELKKYNFSAVQVDPAMVLYLDPKWNNFDDYLNALKSKFRVKAKKAYKTSSLVTSQDFSPSDIKKHQAQLTQMYTNVIEKSSFNMSTLDLSTYVFLKEKHPTTFIFKGYFLNGDIVGFMSGMLNNDSLDAHFIGINYDNNKTHAIYSRILYDYVNAGIKSKVKSINFGRTSGEIKSSLGAIPIELTCYIRHKKSVANFFFKPFLKRIKTKQFEQRFPFKKTK